MTITKRRGKVYELKGVYKHVRFSLETVDADNLKSLTYTLKFYYTGELENYKTVTNILFRATRQVLATYMDGVLFKKDFISVSNQSEYPRATPTYCDFEFTCYPTHRLVSKMLFETLFMNISKRLNDQVFKQIGMTTSKK